MNYQIILVITLSLFGIRMVRNLLYQMYIWQLKEYRIDRMLIHLLSVNGQRWMFGNLSLIKWILLIIYSIYPPARSFIYPIAIAFILEAVLIFREWLGGVKKPIITAKIIFIILLAISIGTLVYFMVLPIPLLLLILDKLLPIVTSSLILLIKIPVHIYNMWLIKKAQKKIENYPKLIRIGITGSFGKSSTKEFLAEFLSEKYVVVKTEKNFNTDIGIAQTILGKITEKTDVFVAEMGAYKQGEIKQVTKIVKPSIGVITGINEQHIELFGSLANTRHAKYELIESLPAHGLAVFNWDNEYTRQMAKKTKNIQVKTYGAQSGATYKLSKVIQDQENITFSVSEQREIFEIKAKLYGEHFANNLVGAIIVARYLGVSWNSIKKVINTINKNISSMKKVGEVRGATLIDDTYNANPDGVKQAIEFMKCYLGKKYIVLTPLIELGENTKFVHQDIARAAFKNEVEVLLTNKSAFLDMKIYGEKQAMQNVSVLSQAAIESLYSGLKKDDVVVFSGKESKRVLRSILNKKN